MTSTAWIRPKATSAPCPSPPGTWTYTIDNTLDAVQELGLNQSFTETFRVWSADGTDSQLITVTVNGANDPADITIGVGDSATGSVTEDAVMNILTETGSLTVSDVDAGQDAFDVNRVDSAEGNLGSLSITSDGTWTYTIDNTLDAVQELGLNQSFTETFRVWSADGTDSQLITVSVNGANDPADITIGVGDSATGSVTEDAVMNILTETGSLTVSDVDAGQDAFDVNRVDSAEGNLGSLSITSDGTWTYTIDNTLDAVQELGLNQSFTETFRVWSADGTDSQLITVSVNGANDPADITIGVGDSATGSVTEDAVMNILTETVNRVSAEGSLTVSDVDAGQDAFDVNRVDSAEGNLGSLSITSDGTWTYTIDNTLDAVQELGLNQSFTESFRVWSADGTDSQLITVSVNGANDPADITIGVGDSATGSVTEDAVMNILTETGSLTVSDVDAGQDAFDVNRVDSAEGNLGSLSITSDGTWTYTIDNTLDAVQELGLNQSFTETFRVWSADGTDSQLITVTVNGANDPADITIGVGDSATGSVTEDAVLNTLTETGSLTVSDVDAGQDAFDVNRVDSAEGNLGSLSITSDGTWTYTIDNTLDAVQELGLNQSFTETFRVWSADGTDSQLITVTVNGANDPADITIGVGDSATGSVTEDAVLNILTETGSLTVSDVDAGQDAFDVNRVDSAEGNLGSLSITSDGTWTYTIDNTLDAVQELGLNQSFTETFRVWSADGTDSQLITVTVNGANDAPELTFTAADTSYNYIQGGSFEGVNIDPTDWASGYTPPEWTKEAGDRWEVMSGTRNGIPGATDGDNVIDTGVGDGAALSISQQVNGLTEGEYAISFDIFDRGENLGEEDSGNVDVYWNGELVGSINPGSDAWEVGTFTVTVAEGETSGTLTLTAHNPDTYGNVIDNVAMYAVQPVADDTPILVDENITPGSILATAIGSDIDSEGLTYSIVGDDPTFTIDQDGNITLAAGQTLDHEAQDSYTVTVAVSDGETQTTKNLTINVNDVNEAPIAPDLTLDAVGEDSGSHIITEAQLLAGAYDPDEGDTANLQVSDVTVADGEGTIIDNHDGTWTFTPDAEWNGTMQFEYTVTDGELSTTRTADLEVTSVNDGPTIEFATAIGEDNLIQGGSFEGVEIDPTDWASGYAPPEWTREGGDRWEVMSGTRHGIPGATDGDNVIDTGVGNGEALSISQQVTGLTEGEYVISLDLFDRGERLNEPDTGNVDIYWNGELVGTLNPDSEAWETGTIIVSVAEGESTGTLTLTAHNPDTYGNVIDNISMHRITTLTGDAAIDENSAPGTYVATAVGSDIDSTDLTFSIVSDDPTFTIDENGVITLAPGQSLDHEAQDSYTITVAVSDGDITTTRDLTISVGDVNETPVNTPISMDSLAEDTPLLITKAQLLAGTDDPEEGDLDITNLTVAQGQGSLVDNGDGTWTFTPASEWSGDVQFSYSVSDGEFTVPQTASMTVTSDNDAPVASAETITADEGDGLLTGKVTASDVDGDTLTYALVGEAPDGFTFDTTDGSWTFDASDDAYNSMADGDSATYDLQFTVTDGHGGSVTQPLTITINGTNDGPVASAETITADEGDGLLTGKVTASDVDGDTLTYALVGDAPDGFTFDTTDGSWTFDASDDAYNSMADGDSATYDLQFTVTDGHGGSVTQPLTITINGTNDGPVASAETITADEGDGLLTGKVTASDVDGDTLTYALVGDAPDGFTFDTTDGSWTFDASDDAYNSMADGDSATYDLQFTVTDGHGGSVTQPLTITVNGTNDGPVASAETITADEGDGLLTGKVTASDVDGDTLTYALVGEAPDGFTFDTTDGSWTFDASDDAYNSMADGDSATYDLQFTVTDGHGGSVTQPLTITVNGTNDGPVASAETITADEGDGLLTGKVTASDVDGDTLTYALVGEAPDGFTFDTTDGSWTFDASDDAYNSMADGDSATYDLQFTVTDGHGGSVTQPLTITVNGTNDGPVASAETITTDEGDGLLTGKVTASDVDGDTLTYALVGEAPDGFTFDTTDGSWTFDASDDAYNSMADGDSATYDLQFTVTDGHGGSVTQPLTITVNGTNDGPVASAETITADEGDGLLTGKVTASDVDGDTLTYALVGEAPDGFTFDTTDGSWTFDASDDAYNSMADGDSATYDLQFTVTDGHGGSVTQPLTITVNGTNDGPVASAETITADEGDGLLTGKVTASDVDGDTLTYALVGEAPDGFTFDTTDGSWTFDASDDAYNSMADGDSATYDLQFTVTDGHGGSVTQPLTITVNGTNDGPVASAETITADEGDGLLTGKVTASDVDGDTLTYALVGDAPDGFTFDTTDGSWTFDASDDAYNSMADGDSATYDLQFTVTDGHGGSVTQPLTITVNGTNDGPVASAETITADEGDGLLTGKVTASDVDGDTLTYALVGDAPDGFTFDTTDGSWTFDASDDAYNSMADGDSATYDLQFTVTDGHGGSVTQPLTITVNGTNDGPVASAETITADEGDGLLTGKVTASDVDGDTLTYALVGEAPDGFTFDTTDGSWTFDASDDAYNSMADGDSATYDLQFTVTDGHGGSVTQPLTITINGTNDGPVASAETITADEGDGLLTGKVTASDVDGDTLTYALVGEAPDGFTFDTTDGSWTFDASDDAYNSMADGDSATYDLQFTVTDGHGGSVTQPLTITINGTNDGPVASAETITADEGDGLLTGKVTASDVDGDTLTYALVGEAPDGFTFDTTDGSWTFDASDDAYNSMADGDSATYDLQFTVTDGHGGSVTQPLTITVNGTNDGPVASAETITADEGDGLLTGKVTASDVDGDTLTYALVGDAPDGFTFDTTDGSWTFDASDDAYNSMADGDSATYDLQFTVTDGHGGSVTQPLTITVNGTNDGPVASAETITADEGDGLLTGKVTASDVDGDTLTYALVGDAPDGFTFDTTDGSWTFDASDDAYNSMADGDSATYDLQFTVTDGHGGSVTQPLTITVNGTNDGPVASAETITADEGDGLLTGKVTASDVDGDTLTYALVGEAPDGFTFDTTDGSWTFDASDDAYNSMADGDSATYDLQFTVTDGHGGSVTQPLTITINGTNDGPVASAETITADEGDGLLTGKVTASDVDGDTLTYALVGEAPDGFTFDTTDGSWTFDASDDAYNSMADGDSATYDLQFTVTDGHGGSVTQPLTITINGTNDGPVAVADEFGTVEIIPGISVDVDTPVGTTDWGAVAASWAENGVQVTALKGNVLNSNNWTNENGGIVISGKNINSDYDSENEYAGLGVHNISGDTDSGEIDGLESFNGNGYGGNNSSELISVSFEQGMDTVNLELGALFDGVRYDAGHVELARIAVYGESTTPNGHPTLLGYVDVAADDDGLVHAYAPGQGNSLIDLGTVSVTQGEYDGILDITLTSDVFGADITLVAMAPRDNGLRAEPNNSDFLLKSVSASTDSEINATYFENQGPITIEADDLILNDSDPDGDTLSVIAVGNALHGTVTMDEDGHIEFTPEADFSGQATFTYTISDGHGGTSEATVTLNIAPVQNAPDAGDVSLTMAEDGSLLITEAQILANVSDADTDSEDLSVTSLSVNGGDLTNNGDGTWTFTPAEDFNGELDLTYTVSDGQNVSTGSGTITVTPTADPAEVSGDITGTATEDTATTVTGTLVVDDPDAGEAFFVEETLSGEGHYGTLTIDADGEWTYTVDNGTEAVQSLGVGSSLTDEFTVTTADGTKQTLTLTINGDNDAPEAADDHLTVTVNDSPAGAGETISLTIPQVTDANSLISSWQESGVTVAGHRGTVTDDKVTVTSDDVTLTVDATNNWNSQIGGIGIAGGAQNGEVDYFSDVHGESEMLSLNFENPMDTVNITLSYFYKNDSHGADELARVYAYGADGELLGTVDIEANSHTGLASAAINADAFGGTPIASMYIVPISDGQWDNSEFALRAVGGTVAETPSGGGLILDGEHAITITAEELLANDSDIDVTDTTRSIASVSNAVGGEVVLNEDGTISFTPDADAQGPLSFQYTVVDEHGAESEPATVTIDLEGNVAPVAGDVSLTMAEDGTLTINEADILASVSDANEGDDLTVTGLSVDGGTLTDNHDGTWTFKPDADFNGSLNMSYTVSDGQASDTGSGVITVEAVNDAPLLTVDDTSYSTNGDPVSIAGDVSISDVDSTMMSKAVITLDGTQTGDVLNTDGVSGGLFVEPGTDSEGNLVITLSGDATAAEYESAIKAITFSTTSESDTAREIAIQVTDSEGNLSKTSDLITSTINVEVATDPAMYDGNVTGQDITFVSEDAGYSNMLGIYTVVKGKPSDPDIIMVNSKKVAEESLRVLASDKEIRFFLIPNGANMNLDLSKDLHFIMDNNSWALALGYGNDSRIVDVKFDDPQFNPNGEEATFRFPWDPNQDAGINQSWYGSTRVEVDDQTSDDNDNDFNDLKIDVKYTDDGVFEGGNGNDTAKGWIGDDTLSGGGGADKLYGGDHNDQLDGGTGNDYLNGGTGNDTLIGGSGDDTLIGGDGNDLLNGGTGHDYLNGGTGNDTLIGGSGDDTLMGGDGNDLLSGGLGDDYMDGGTDHDTLSGGDGNDTILGGHGNDFLLGGDGNDHMDGGTGNDQLSGGEGNDILVGGDGDDLLIGGGGDDLLIGGNSNDLIIASTGHDHVDLGYGNDTIFIDQSVLADNDGQMVVSDFNLGQDVLELGNGLSIHDVEINSNGDTQLLLGGEGTPEFTLILEGVTSDHFASLEGVTPQSFESIAHVDTSDATADSLIQMLIEADNKSDF